MPRRALIDSRPWLFAGIVMAIAFWVLSDSALGGWFLIALKGGSVAALAVYARTRGKGRDATLVAAVMAIGAAGDAGIELSTVAGGALFLLAHLVAIYLYRVNARPNPTSSQFGAAIALVIGTPILAWMLADDLLAIIYAFVLGTMAGSAWLSRFSRYHLGVGALLFVASDLLIFARLGGVLDQSLTEWFVWPLYYAGQFLICTGVIRTIRRDHQA